MPTEIDPLAAIAEETPEFTDEEAIEIARTSYGLDVTVKSLVSERDQNFQLQASAAARYVLKIANHAEDPMVTDFQIEALLHIARFIERYRTPISTPVVMPTLDGATHIVLQKGGKSHVARVVSYLGGVPIGDHMPTAKLSRQMGIYLAHLGRALQHFEHPGSHQSLLWDVQRTSEVRPLIVHVPEEALRTEILRALDDFETYALPAFASLRRQVIHNDLNPDNVLISAPGAEELAGVIDFGDMLEAPLIADVAIAGSYLRPQSGDPLALIAEFVAGYAAITPLQTDEIDNLFDLVRARLCTSVVILYWRASYRDAGDPYLEKLLRGESIAEDYLARLNAVPRDHALRTLRQVCASNEVR